MVNVGGPTPNLIVKKVWFPYLLFHHVRVYISCPCSPCCVFTCGERAAEINIRKGKMLPCIHHTACTELAEERPVCP
jgi:hypothetical protein